MSDQEKLLLISDISEILEQQYGITPRFGFELEFYVTRSGCAPSTSKRIEPQRGTYSHGIFSMHVVEAYFPDTSIAAGERGDARAAECADVRDGSGICGEICDDVRKNDAECADVRARDGIYEQVDDCACERTEHFAAGESGDAGYGEWDKFAEIFSKIQLAMQRHNLDLALSKERGRGQFELATLAISDAIMTAQKIKKVKSVINEVCDEIGDVKALFSPKPYSNDYGSALQINVSLHVNENGLMQNKLYDVFIADDRSKIISLYAGNIFAIHNSNDNKVLQLVIAGLLSSANDLLYTFCVDSSHFDRCATHNFMAPSTISWGYNNRTTAIRIPECHIADKSTKHLEYRIPSANSDPLSVLLAVNLGILHGLYSQPEPFPQTYMNAHDVEQMGKLHGTLERAKKMCNIAKYIDIVKKFR